jgi:hypothetical protein
MIQRIQTVWLFLAALCAAFTFQFAFYSGNVTEADNKIVYKQLVASSDFLLLIFTAGLIAGCIILIFLYKNRKQQFWITVVAAGLSIINLIIYFSKIKKFTNGTMSLGAVLAFFIPVFLLLASSGIWKDEKLVKSLDRLR